MSVPLKAKKELVGIVYFANQTANASFSALELDFAKKLAMSISLALENTRLYKAERNIANTLQKALLAMPKEIPHVRFGALYRSATETAQVGGDFYDVFSIDDRHVAVLIGDVSGKGVNAAALTSLVKNTIKAYTHEHIVPGTILRKTNTVIIKSHRPGAFVTVFLGILNTNTGVLSYANAGHPPPIIKRADGSLSLLRLGIQPLRVFDHLEFPKSSINLGKKDILVLYTDGVTESRCPDTFLGEERLLEFIADSRRSSSERLPARIYNKLKACDCRLVDDLALVAISLAD